MAFILPALLAGGAALGSGALAAGGAIAGAAPGIAAGIGKGALMAGKYGLKAAPRLAKLAAKGSTNLGQVAETGGSNLWNAGVTGAGKIPGAAEAGASKLWNLGAEGATKAWNYKGMDGGSMMQGQAQGAPGQGPSSFNPGLSETTGREMPSDLMRVAEQQRGSAGPQDGMLKAYMKKRMLEKAQGGGGQRDVYSQPAPPAMELPDYATAHAMGSYTAPPPQPSLSQYIGAGGY